MEKGDLIKNLKNEMQAAAQKENYEEAASLRDKIRSLEKDSKEDSHAG